MKQASLLPDDLVKNAAADRPWKKSETDRMLDMYFDGTPPDRIAIKLQRNPKAIKRRIEAFSANENGRAESYEPFRRLTRHKQRVSESEVLLIASHKRNGVPKDVTAKVLQRSVSELYTPPTVKPELSFMKKFIPAMEIIMALRYFHFCHRKNSPFLIVSDKDYDDLVHEECEYGGQTSAFTTIKCMDVRDYPHRIRWLMEYLIDMRKQITADDFRK